MIGPIMRQGPHHSAQQSRIRREYWFEAASTGASVIMIGFPGWSMGGSWGLLISHIIFSFFAFAGTAIRAASRFEAYKNEILDKGEE